MADEIDLLIPCMMRDWTIVCDKCDTPDYLSGDLVGTLAALRFFKTGWRFKNDRILCPDCAFPTIEENIQS